MGIRIQPNFPLQRSGQAQIQRNESNGGFFSSIWQVPKRISAFGRSCVPCDKPTEILRRISEGADRGLQRAKARKVPIKTVAPLHGQLDQLLNQSGISSRVDGQAAEVGEVADLGDLPPDPEVTRAPLLQDRVDSTQWHAQIKLHQEDLKNKLSIFIILLQMRDRCGIPEDNLKIMALVKQATATDSSKPLSVWELFTSNYKLTFFQWLKAAWAYWFYYQTSLITNTIDAYLVKFIENITNDLTKDSNDTRTKVFRTLIENTNQFLLEDIRATKNFAFEKESGDIGQCRNRAIEKHYGFSLPALCQAFSEAWVDKISPRVRFFKDFQKIPLLKIPFQAFEWLVNKFIIQRTMIHSILPLSLESVVGKGLEATQPDKLPFAISITKFFTQQLEKLRSIVEDDRFSPSNEGKNSPGTEMLSSTIKLLLQALELEGDFTPLELRKKIAQMERGKKGPLGPRIADKIEQGIIDASDLLFWYLNETTQSGKLLAQFLELSLAPFSSEARDEASLRAEFEEEKLKFERTGESVFKELVKKRISKKFNESDAELIRSTAKQKFDAQKIIAQDLVEKISNLSAQMDQKIQDARERATKENNIQEDIASFFEIMQVLTSRKEFQEEMKDLDSINRDEIQRSLNPLLESIKKIQERMLKLQEAQDHYPTHSTVAQSLSELQTVLATLRDQFHDQTRHPQHPLVQSLEQIAKEIEKGLGTNAPLVHRLKLSVAEISELAASITKEQKAIDAIHALYPPRNEGENNVPEGLLGQLLNYQRGEHQRGFKPSVCLSEIAKRLIDLAPNEKRELEVLIGNGSNLNAKQAELGQLLQRIYGRHSLQKIRDQAQLDQALDSTRTWAQEKSSSYNYVKGKDYQKMQSEMSAISTEAQTLQRKAQKIKSNLTLPISASIWKKLSVVAPAAAAFWGGPVWGALAGIGGGAWHKYMRGGDNSWFGTSLKLGGVAIGCLGIGLAPLGAAMSTVTTATGGLFGWTVCEGGISWVKDNTFDQVWNIFKRGYDFSLKPRIYKAAATRSLQAMVEASGP